MPNFYYVVFQYNSLSQFFPKRLTIKDFTDIKPFEEPHFCFDFREIEFMLTGQWDMWVKPTYDDDDELVAVEKIINCNVALEKENNYPELYIMLTEFCSPQQPDDKLLPELYTMEREYWERHTN